MEEYSATIDTALRMGKIVHESGKTVILSNLVKYMASRPDLFQNLSQQFQNTVRSEFFRLVQQDPSLMAEMASLFSQNPEPVYVERLKEPFGFSQTDVYKVYFNHFTGIPHFDAVDAEEAIMIEDLVALAQLIVNIYTFDYPTLQITGSTIADMEDLAIRTNRIESLTVIWLAKCYPFLNTYFFDYQYPDFLTLS